jgi:hypothetical protein
LKAGLEKEDMTMASENDTAVEELNLDDGSPETGAGSKHDDTPPAKTEDRGDAFTPTGEDDDDDPASKTDAGAADAGSKAEDDAGTGKRGVPPERFNEVTRAKREAEEKAAALAEENDRLKQQLAASAQKPAPAVEQKPESDAAPAFDMKAKQKEAADALLEGDMDKYADLQAEIYAHVADTAAAKAIETAKATNDKQAEQDAVQSVATAAVAKYPFLDKETGDKEAIGDVVAWRDLYISRGMRASEALQKAVDKVAPLYGDAKPTDGGGITDPRPAAAAKRAAAMADGQPPLPTGGLGERATANRINVGAMSESEFKNLSEADKKRLRGD